MAAYLAGHGEELEDVVRTAMKLVGEQMAETGKEYVCILCISLLKTDLISGRYRFMCHGLDMRNGADRHGKHELCGFRHGGGNRQRGRVSDGEPGQGGKLPPGRSGEER